MAGLLTEVKRATVVMWGRWGKVDVGQMRRDGWLLPEDRLEAWEALHAEARRVELLAAQLREYAANNYQRLAKGQGK